MSVGNAPAGEVVGRELDLDPVAREDADVVLAHLSGDLRQHLVPAVDLDAEHRARQGLDDLAFHLDLLFLLSHYLLTRNAPLRGANRTVVCTWHSTACAVPSRRMVAKVFHPTGLAKPSRPFAGRRRRVGA